MAEPSSVNDLMPGDHACLTFTDPDERLDIVAAFVSDGLRGNQRVVCYTDAVAPQALIADLQSRELPVEDALRDGRLVIDTSTEAYLSGGAFEAARMIDAMALQIHEAERAGYDGLRITGDMCWALRPVAGVEQLVGYEYELTALLSAGGALAVCQYDRECFDPVTLATVSASHDRAVAAVTYHDDALLRICRQHVPAGVRVAGELDFRAVEVFNRAMSEAVRLDEDIDLNLTNLRFLDAAAAGVILQAAVSLPLHRRVTVRCQPLAAKVLRTIGAHDVANLRMVVSDVEY